MFKFFQNVNIHKWELTTIQEYSDCLKFLWNSSLICTMSTSQREAMILTRVSSSVPRPFIALCSSMAKWVAFERITRTASKESFFHLSSLTFSPSSFVNPFSLHLSLPVLPLLLTLTQKGGQGCLMSPPLSGILGLSSDSTLLSPLCCSSAQSQYSFRIISFLPAGSFC